MVTISEVQGVSKEQSSAGLRTAIDIIAKWGASIDQTCRILRISRSTHRHVRRPDVKQSVNLDSDQLQRISLVLNIHAALRQTFDNPANVYGFPAMANDNDFFNGRPPLDIMAQGDMIALYETFRRIELLRGSSH